MEQNPWSVIMNGPQMDWKDDGNLSERFKKWRQEAETKMRLFEVMECKPRVYTEAIFQWAGAHGQTILTREIPSIRSTATDATEEMHQAEREKFQNHLAILERYAQPRGDHIVAFGKLRSLQEGDQMHVTNFISELEKTIPKLTLCEGCSDKVFNFALATGISDARAYRKCLDLKADETKAIYIETVLKDRATNDFVKQKFGDHSADVHALHSRKQYGKKFDKGKSSHPSSSGSGKQCLSCGTYKHFKKEDCNVYKKGIVCNKCHKKGHLAKMCMSGSAAKPSTSSVKEMQAQPTQFQPPPPYDTQGLPGVQFCNLKSTEVKAIHSLALRPIWLKTEPNGKLHELQCEVDSGAGCDVMPWPVYTALYGNKKLDKPTTRITAYGGVPVQSYGSCVSSAHLEGI